MRTVPDHPNGTEAETALCAAMEREGVDHEHRSLHFRIRRAGGHERTYEPPLAARRGPILFLLEPLEAEAWDETRRDLLRGFLEQHSPDIVLVLVVPERLIPEIPGDAYDEIYPMEDLAAVARRIREQDPRGLLRPFPKPHPTDGAH